MKTKSLPPYAPTLIESTRAIGYSLEAAVADIIDNSIAANAKKVDIYFFPIDGAYIAILDNGKGMTREQIRGVLTGNKEHSTEEGDSTGIGMNNVISRLELYYEQSGLVEINSEGEGKGTEVVIHIPLERR